MSEGKRYTYTFVEEPLNVSISQDVEEDDYNNHDYDEEIRQIIRERTAEYYGINYEEQPKNYSLIDQYKNINKLSFWERIDLACASGLFIASFFYVFFFLLVGLIINAAFWAINIWVFTDLMSNEKWMLFVVIPIDFIIFVVGSTIFRKWWIPLLVVSFGLAMLVKNL